ncbi:MAG: hypothetical protein GY810_14145 [Aureispira sp.]|nr:hypothetical protein [Aureispira sp.]
MSSDLTQQIVLAAEAGKLDTVKELLEKGANPGAMGPNSGALHCAAFGGHIDIVKLLLKKGADPNTKDNQNFYPLHLAASKGETAICNALIKSGANVENTTDKGGTALHVAAASNFGPTVSALLKAGANIEAKDQWGNTPLSSACNLGNTKIVKALLKAEADIETTNQHGETPLIYALHRLYETRVDGWKSEGDNGGVPVKYEVTKGAFIYTRDYVKAPNSGSILSLKDQRYCASQDWGPQKHLDYLNALDTVKVLTKAGADLHKTDSDGKTAMSIACHAGEAKIIEILFKKGASFETVDKDGVTPLHLVAGSGRLDGLEVFFKKAKVYKINAEDQFGWTPLHYLADIGGPIKMATLLLENGANRKHKSTKDRGTGCLKGSTPEAIALHWKDKAMADAIKA